MTELALPAAPVSIPTESVALAGALRIPAGAEAVVLAVCASGAGGPTRLLPDRSEVNCMVEVKTVASNPSGARTLRGLKGLEGYKISAKDGHIGRITDFLFDDEFWVVRYLVVDTGHWLPGRKVLLSPGVVLNADWREHSLRVALSREEVKTSPDIDTDQPVSRQREIELHTHYGWPFYWTGGTWPEPLPIIVPPEAEVTKVPKEPGDPHLRSIREIIGYSVMADDGEIGFIDDFIAENETWVVRYLVVSTHKWLPGRKVLISPQWLVGPISWSARTVKLFMTRASVRNSPEFNPAAPVNREYETALYNYYGRPRYWT